MIYKYLKKFSMIFILCHKTLRSPSSKILVLSIYYISAVNTQQMQRPNVLVQLGYIWRHVSALNRTSSGQQGIVLLMYIQIVFPKRSHWYIKTGSIL